MFYFRVQQRNDGGDAENRPGPGTSNSTPSAQDKQVGAHNP